MTRLKSIPDGRETITADGKEIKVEVKSHQHLNAPSADFISHVPDGIERPQEKQRRLQAATASPRVSNVSSEQKQTSPYVRWRLQEGIII